jgi:signal transduction histidine kinase
MSIDGQDSISGAVVIEGHLVAFVATLFRSNNDVSFLPQLPYERPALVFYSVLTDFDIRSMGTSNRLDELTFSIERPAGPGRLPLNSVDGSLLGWFSWRTRAPGTDMALDLVWPSLLLVLLVFAAMVRFIRQAGTIMEGLEQANRAKTSFLASMSHEVRTPLNSILGFAELMSLEIFGKIEGEKNKEYLQLIRNSGEHLLTIINDILDISKLEAGKFDVYAEKVHPNDIIDDSIRMVEPSAEERGITITKHREKASIYSDERIIRQVLINILSNAIKFTPRGGAVHVEASRAEDYYQILITDNGIGMSETEIEIALSTFGQVRNGLAKRHGGTGLGLPLVARFMKLLGGNIVITSNPGKGTSVTLFLPYKVDPE